MSPSFAAQPRVRGPRLHNEGCGEPREAPEGCSFWLALRWEKESAVLCLATSVPVEERGPSRPGHLCGRGAAFRARSGDLAALPGSRGVGEPGNRADLPGSPYPAALPRRARSLTTF